MMYTVAMLRKGKDLQLMTLKRGVMTLSYHDDLKKIEDLQNEGFELESCIMTNKQEVFYKHKLKGRIAEYNNYLEYGGRTLSHLHLKHGADSEVYKDTLRLLSEHRATLKKQVAMCALRCLDLGVPVNELALDCVFDYNRELERGAK